MDKVFRDPLYGYIYIPDQYCRDFIDTDIFQRLRRIEQTSMRVLYPSAHHDRFAHSLGVYHLSKLAFDNLHANSVNFFDFSKETWDTLSVTFQLASLLHDCGHSPFSHTFEHYYVFQKGSEIDARLFKFFKQDEHFVEEYRTASPNPHEIISSLVLLEKFHDKITTYGGDPLLAARMIMGCTFNQANDLETKFKNKLIKLLNGTAIDVDSLDYIQRDTWASGVSNISIDYNRLLSALMIAKDPRDIPVIVFKRQALSVLSSISIGRNFLYKWIYSHHKVLYEQNLLKQCTKIIDENFDRKFCSSVFSIDAFYAPIEVNNFSYFLPTDDDIYSTLKRHVKEDNEIYELLSRKYKFKAIWKTYFEYEQVFQNVHDDNRLGIETRINNGELENYYGPKCAISLEAKPKLKGIRRNDFFISIDNKMFDASQAVKVQEENLKYFILYIKKDIEASKDDIIDKCLSFQN